MPFDGQYPQKLRLQRLTKDKAGLSIIVATLLLIVIAVAASVIIFSFVQGFVSQTSSAEGVPTAQLTFNGPMNWNKGFSKAVAKNDQVTFLIRNLGDAVDIDSVSITDSQGNILQLVDTFNSTSRTGTTATQTLSFQIYSSPPDASSSDIAHQDLKAGANYLTVDFGDTGILQGEGFKQGVLYHFKVILKSGFAINFTGRAA